MPTETPAIPPPPRLRRLPGRTPTFRSSRSAARTQLWIDAGQLVQESVRGYTQEIQRFALADILAVQIRRTVRGLVYNVVLCAFVVLPLIGLVTQMTSERPDTAGIVTLSIIVGVLGLLLLVNTLRGPTCRTTLTTALGPQGLPSLCRMRVARRVLDAIITQIDAVQGALTPDEAVRQVDRARVPAVSNAPAPARPGYHY